MFACSRLKIDYEYNFELLLETKKRLYLDLRNCNFVVVSLSIIAITGRLAEWMKLLV